MTMKKRFTRAAVPVGAALVAAGVVVAASTADDPSKTTYATPVAAALGTGHDAPREAVDALRKNPDVMAFAPRLVDAREVTPPPGAEPEASWVLAPAKDGGACLHVETITTCGTAADIATGYLSVRTVAPPKLTAAQVDANRRAEARGEGLPYTSRTLGGDTRTFGIAPVDVDRVVAADGSGKVMHQAEVRNGLYLLKEGTERRAVRAYRFEDASGNVIASKNLRQ